MYSRRYNPAQSYFLEMSRYRRQIIFDSYVFRYCSSDFACKPIEPVPSLLRRIFVKKTHVKYHKRNVCPKQEEAWKHGLSQRLRRNHPRWIFKRGVDRFRGRIYTGHVSRFTNRISIPLLFELRATTSATSNFADSVWLSFRYCGALP